MDTHQAHEDMRVGVLLHKVTAKPLLVGSDAIGGDTKMGVVVLGASTSPNGHIRKLLDPYTDCYPFSIQIAKYLS
jgi:hypothetical protein